MKVVILSESPADEAAIRILAEAVLECEIEVVSRRPRAGGWQSALRVLPSTVRELHYRRTADGLIVVIDADDSTLHSDEHEQDDADVGDCRHCRFESVFNRVRNNLTPIPGQAPILTAYCTPPPAIEAWYAFGNDPACTEAGWIQKQRANTRAPDEIRRLKQQVYGTNRPSLPLETARAEDCARELVAKIDQFEAYFQNSFGRLATALRNWEAEA